MSAFIMDEEFFNQLANEIAGRCYSNNQPFYYDLIKFLGLNSYSNLHETTDNQTAVKVQELFNANVRAVNDRYAHLEGFPSNAGVVKAPTGFVRWSNMQLYKHLQCLSYQMSEGDIPETDIYKALDVLIARIASALLADLPEYKICKWDYESATHTVETINA